MKKRKNTKDLLQQIVDHKLKSMHCEHDDLSDYITSYCYNEDKIAIEHLKKWKIDPEDFLTYEPSEHEIKAAVINSSLLNIVMNRFKQAIIKTIPTDIYYNRLPSDKSQIQDELDRNIKEDRGDSLKYSAILKLKKAGCSKQELKALNIW